MGKRVINQFFVESVFLIIITAAVLIACEKIWKCQISSFKDSFRDEAYTTQIWCNNLDILVVSHDHNDTMVVCEGAQDAIMFLESHSLGVTGTIVIELLKELPVSLGSSVAGCYLESERRVLILVYSEFKKFETWFGVPIDRSIFRSAVSHEVAHAVTQSYFTISKPSIQAKEYIAYITQFSTMEPMLRKKVLSKFQGEAFEGDSQIHSTIYMLDPMGFGPRAYLHFLMLMDGDEYLHAILNGKTLFLDFW
jgi:hypothetical protein